MKDPFSMPILQSDPGASYYARQEEIDTAVLKTLASKWYILGKEVGAFEQEFAAYLGCAGVAGVASGTDAIQLALHTCGVEPGDAVFTVSHTAVATCTAIVLSGAVPVFVDIDPITFTMDPASLEAAIRCCRLKQRAIIPVHLYGHPADMTAIMEIARRNGLKVIEDCAQSHGAKWKDRHTGTWGDMAAFSFYPTKNLGAFGDGGAVASCDPELIQRAKLLREYGWKERYVSSEIGMNTRLDELQAAILRVKLRYLDKDNDKRRHLASVYDRGLDGLPCKLPVTHRDSHHVFHQYVIRSDDRDALRAYLREHEIGSLVHYPVPVHLQSAYARFACDDLSNTVLAAKQILSLPIYPELESAVAAQVTDTIRKFGSTG